MLGAMVTASGFAGAGWAVPGWPLASSVAGRETLLRAVRSLNDPKVGEVSVLGIDDFAILRGQMYGTLVLGRVTSKPIDLLADRTSDTVAT